MSAAAEQPFASILADALSALAVVSAYKETTRLPRNMRRRANYFSRVPWTHDVRIAVEKSADRSLELARRLAAEQVNFYAIVNAVHRGER